MERLLSLAPLDWKERALVRVSLFFLREQRAVPRRSGGMHSSSGSTPSGVQLPQLMFHSQWAAFYYFFSGSPAVIFIGPYCVIDLFNKIFFLCSGDYYFQYSYSLRRHCQLWARTMHFFNTNHSPSIKSVL